MPDLNDFFVFNKIIEVHSIIEKSDEKGENVYPVVDKNQGGTIIGTVLDHSSLLHSTLNNPAHIRRIYVTTEAMPVANKVREKFQEKIRAREVQRSGEKP